MAKTRPKPKAKRTRKPVGKPWGSAEIKQLRADYKKNPASMIAEKLKRSEGSVRAKIRALGLTKGPVRKATTKARPKAKAKVKRKGRGY